MIGKITQKNFTKAVNRANVLNKKVHVDNRYTKKVILPLGSIIFALNITLLILGGFCYALEQGTLSPEQAEFLNSVQFVTPYWRFIWGLFGAITDLTVWKIVMVIAFAFLLPVIICNITTFIFSRCTKTETFTTEGTEKETATQLHKFVHEIPVSVWDGIYEQEDNWLGITDLFVSAGFAVFFFCYWFSISAEYEMFKRILLAALVTAIMVVIFFYLYMALFRLFFLMIRRCYYHHSPWFRFSCKVDDYYYKFYPEELAAKLERERNARRRIYISDRVKETSFYKDQVNSYVNTYTGNTGTSDTDGIKKIIEETELDLSGKGYGRY